MIKCLHTCNIYCLAQCPLSANWLEWDEPMLDKSIPMFDAYWLFLQLLLLMSRSYFQDVPTLIIICIIFSSWVPGIWHRELLLARIELFTVQTGTYMSKIMMHNNGRKDSEKLKSLNRWCYLKVFCKVSSFIHTETPISYTFQCLQTRHKAGKAASPPTVSHCDTQFGDKNWSIPNSRLWCNQQH